MKLTVVGLVAGIALIAYIVHLRGEITILENQLDAVSQAPPAAPARSVSAAAPIARPNEAPAPQAASLPAAAVSAPEPRRISEVQRTIMIEKLSSDGYNTGSPVWFATVPNDPEAAAFQKALQSVFEEAGWKVQANGVVGFQMKPGIFIFAADEFPPQYVTDVSGAFEASGVPLASNGRGYRDYFKQRKEENPSWVGFEMEATQDFVIAIGRQPTS